MTDLEIWKVIRTFVIANDRSPHRRECLAYVNLLIDRLSEVAETPPASDASDFVDVDSLEILADRVGVLEKYLSRDVVRIAALEQSLVHAMKRIGDLEEGLRIATAIATENRGRLDLAMKKIANLENYKQQFAGDLIKAMERIASVEDGRKDATATGLRRQLESLRSDFEDHGHPTGSGHTGKWIR